MKQTRKKWADVMPVFVHILAWTTLLWIILLSLALVITLNFTLKTNYSRVDTALKAQATALATSSNIRTACKTGICPESMMLYLDTLHKDDDDLTALTIANSQGIRVYHVQHDKIGLYFVGGDEQRALSGEAYFSNATGAQGPQHRYFCPVLDEDGSVIGFVMTATAIERLQELSSEIYKVYGNFAVVLAILTCLFSLMLAFILQSWLHSISPNELMRLYLTQTELLDSLDEGLMSADSSGKLLFLNRAAEDMLEQRGDTLLNSHVDDVILSQTGESLLNGPIRNISTNYANILATVPALRPGKHMDSKVIILKDKTELMRQAEQLNGTRHIIDSLRANNHEFMNKLHVISGLLQIGKTQEAIDYIGDVSEINSGAISPIMQSIYNPSVAALLLGKLANARERDISLTLLSGSRLPEHSRYLSSGDLVTVIGNLLENAIEAVNIQHTGASRNIALQIVESKQGLLIVVSDTGIGISPENLEKIYQKGFSTKALDGRGIGMSLIYQIVEKAHGTIDVDSEVGCGTTFTLIFNQERNQK